MISDYPRMGYDTYNCGSIKDPSGLFKLLAEPNRLKILCSLGLECRPVSDIIEATGLSQTNVSFQLRALREAGVVRPEILAQYTSCLFHRVCLQETEYLLSGCFIW